MERVGAHGAYSLPRQAYLSEPRCVCAWVTTSSRLRIGSDRLNAYLNSCGWFMLAGSQVVGRHSACMEPTIIASHTNQWSAVSNVYSPTRGLRDFKLRSAVAKLG